MNASNVKMNHLSTTNDTPFADISSRNSRSNHKRQLSNQSSTSALNHYVNLIFIDVYVKGNLYKLSDKTNNTMYYVEDYLMKEKTSKSVFSLTSAVKRLFVLDFSVRAFYYKHSDTTFQCKPICSFREIVNIKEITEHPNVKI